MSAAQIAAHAQRYDLVWASSEPALWRSANPAALISRYYIPEEDNIALSGHDLQYWQQNHPDWILYACDANGNPTHDIAYTPGDRSPDVALDIHNPAVVDYQLNQNLVPYAEAHGYNALAIDEVLMTDLMEGGNPSLGETLNTTEFACGIWNNDGTFTKHYSGRSDPQWTSDIVNWVMAARQATNAANMGLIINHPGGNAADPNERALLANVDAVVDEAGFTDYGNYVSPGHASLFLSALNYMENAQKHGVAFVDIAKYALNGETVVTPDQVEYAMATYLMGNEGGAALYVVGTNAPGVGYGNEQYHSEFATRLGKPCGSYYGGPSVYYRRFVNGLSVVNADSTAASAPLPNHSYTDIEGRAVTNPLNVPGNDAFVLTTSENGCN